MFIAREMELDKTIRFLKSGEAAMLIFGKRRVGKTTLVREALNHVDAIRIFYQCSAEKYEVNLGYLTNEVETALGLSHLHFTTFYEVFTFLIERDRRIVVVFDEYGELKKGYGSYATDSMMQKIVDRLKGTKVSVILSGSSVALMKEVQEESNPLYDRFETTISLKEFDYYDASRFYPSLGVEEKIAYFAVFGGSPNVLLSIDTSLSLEKNIENLMLDPEGKVRGYVERSLLAEYSKIGPALSLFQSIGNGKKLYGELKDRLDPGNTGALAKQLERFISNDAISITNPINHKGEKKRTFYSLDGNAMRFYFTYVHSARSQIETVGPKAVMKARIAPSLETYISYRFEEIVRSYFSRLAKAGALDGIVDIGTWWLDDKKNRTNLEYDCVLEFMDGYEIYEAKHLKAPLDRSLADREIAKMRAIREFKARKLGFVSLNGFSFSDDSLALISGEDLYSDKLL